MGIRRRSRRRRGELEASAWQSSEKATSTCFPTSLCQSWRKKGEKLLLYAHACFNNGINNKYYRLLLIIIKSDSHSILLIKLTRRLTRSPLRNLSRLISSSTAATRMHPRAPS